MAIFKQNLGLLLCRQFGGAAMSGRSELKIFLINLIT